MKLPTIQHLQLHADLSDKPTYAYEFTLKNKAEPLWYNGPDWLVNGADHFDEVQYVFGWGECLYTFINRVLGVG